MKPKEKPTEEPQNIEYRTAVVADRRSPLPRSLLLLALLLLASLLTPHFSPCHAACERSYTQTTHLDGNGSIHTTDGNYYRGAILTLPKAIGVCSITAYLSYETTEETPDNTVFYTLKIWTVDENNALNSLLATGVDHFQGGNWTASGEDWSETRKTFRFPTVPRLPAGRVAITVNDGKSAAHPTNYHAWRRGPAESGTMACAWDGTSEDNCTDQASQMMEIEYVESPYVTAKPHCYQMSVGAPPYDCSTPEHPYMGYLQIPEWAPHGADMCLMSDNMTVACEVPADYWVAGNHKLRARFVPPDGNTSQASGWSFLRFRVRDTGGGALSGTNHPSSDTTATITGEYR
jgi:hypothetical protein